MKEKRRQQGTLQKKMGNSALDKRYYLGNSEEEKRPQKEKERVPVSFFTIFYTFADTSKGY